VALLIGVSKPDWRRIWKPALGGALLGVALLVGAFAVADANQAPYNIMNTAYIPARSNFDTSLAELQSPVGRFVFLITNRQWSSAMFQDPAKDTIEKGGDYYEALPSYFAWPVLGLMAIGFVSLWWGRARIAAFFLLAGLAHHYFVFNYRIEDSYAFYLAWFPFLCALAAAGLGWLLRMAARYLPGIAAGLRPALGAGAILLALLPFAGPSLGYLQQGEALVEGYSFPSNQERAAWYADISRTVKALPANAVVYSDWWSLYAYYYAAYVEQGRTDLWFLEPTPYSIKGGMAKSMVEFAVEQAAKRPVLSLNPLEPLRQAGLKQSNLLAGGARLFEYGR
ncbi:MAG TPA: hypothetical protein PJ988_12715, partial [Anaerolinea sp.]|nr:hypothetical protein [Anaerolinea sp.]